VDREIPWHDMQRLLDCSARLMNAERLQAGADAINQRIYRNVNNGVDRAGFAGSQKAYEEAAEALFETLDWLEGRLKRSRYLGYESVG